MLRFTVRRLLNMALVLVAISIVTFLIFDVIPNGAEPLSPVDEKAPVPTIACLGRLVPHKRIEIVLDALPRLRATHPDLHLNVIGAGPWEERLLDHAKALGVEDAVRFTGWIEESEKLEVASAEETFDRLISTLPAHLTLAITRDPRVADTPGPRPPDALGAHCLILSLDRPLTGRYWIGVADLESPLLAVVEHTAMLEPAAYGGRHLVYLGNYVPHDDRLFDETPDETLARYVPAIRGLNPAFDPSWVGDRWSFGARFAQPIVTPGFRARIPPFETPIPNLFIASMFQVFPHDRGQNYSIDLADRLVGRLEGAAPAGSPG